MKKAVAVLLTVLLIALTGCRGIDTTSSASSNQSNVPGEDSQGAPSLKNPAEITKEEIAQSLQDFKAEINSLGSMEITEFIVEHSENMFAERVAYTTRDKELIERWIYLLKKMELSAKAFDAEDGNMPDGYYYSTNEEGRKNLCFGDFPRFFHDNTAYIYVVNQDELSKEFDELRTAMGIPQ